MAGLTITTIGQPSSTDIFQSTVVMQSDLALVNPVSTLSANFSTVFSSLGISQNVWDVALVYLIKITKPIATQVVYHFQVTFVKKGSDFSLMFRGPKGSTGPQGPMGYQGFNGVTGSTGPKGLQGVTGPQGVQGPQGPAGTAPIFPSGIGSGILGPTGPQGSTGPRGVTGTAGPTGPTGPMGPVGATGPQGVPGVGASGVVFAGDLSGSSTSQRVIGLQTYSVGTSVPTTYNVVMWDGVHYNPLQLTLDPEIIGPAFSASVFATVPLVEVGQTVNSPAFTASYGIYVPTLATLTNSDNLESKNVTGSPTSFTSSQNYSHSSYGVVTTFTLTANKGPLVRSSQTTVTWTQKFYTGVGTAGQTSSAFIQSLTGVLQTYKNGNYLITAGAGQKVYIAYRAAYGTSQFLIGGFNGGFNAPTTVSVTNAHGFTENYYLYESVNQNLGAVTVTVTN